MAKKKEAIYTERIVLMVEPDMKRALENRPEVRKGVSVARIIRDVLEKFLK